MTDANPLHAKPRSTCDGFPIRPTVRNGAEITFRPNIENAAERREKRSHAERGNEGIRRTGNRDQLATDCQSVLR